LRYQLIQQFQRIEIVAFQKCLTELGDTKVSLFLREMTKIHDALLLRLCHVVLQDGVIVD